MTSTAGEILTDIRDTISGTGAFAEVTLGSHKDSVSWPRAEVLWASLDQAQADDTPGSHWLTLEAKVCVYVHSTGERKALDRALDLAQTAQEALLADRFRGQRCRDLPVGKATELGLTKVERGTRSPYLSLVFEVACHFESEGVG